MYLNIYYEAGSESQPQSYIHIWDDKLGYRKIPYTKYAYKLDEKGDYITLYNQPCKLVKRWKKEDIENGLIFESDVHPEMRYLVDNYMNSEDPSDAHVIMNFDIEVSTDGGLPDIHKAENAITSIAYYDSAVKEYTVHLLDPNMQMNDLTMVQRGDNVHVKRHTTEEELLDAFLVDYESIRPTILTGWNCISLKSNIWKKNEIIQICNINKNDNLYDSKVVEVFPISNKKETEIKLINGCKLYASQEHKFPVFVKDKNKYTNFTTNNISLDLKTKEISELYNNKDVFFKIKAGNNDNAGINISTDALYILGLIYTDGSRKDNVVYVYNNSDDVIAECTRFKNSYKKIIREGNGITANGKKGTKRVRFQLSKYNPLSSIIHLIYNQNQQKELDINGLSKLSKEQFYSFLSGIIDGDGCLSKEMISFCNYNNNGDIYKLQELILWNGYISIIENNNILIIPKNQKNKKIPLQLKIKYKNELFNKINFKKSKSKSNNIKYRYVDADDCFYVRLSEINEVERIVPMVDIKTNSGYFYANGIKTHNCDGFDVPYLYNRLKNVFDDKTAKRLSPIGKIYYNKFQERYFIAGISCLDMMKLYKNFTFGQRSSYSLDAIAKLELKEGKIQYDGTLDKLYREDKEKFIDYNVHDVRLVKMIDDKMKFIELAKGICHKGHVPLEDFQFSSRFLDGAILTYLKRKGKIVVPNRPIKEGEFSYTEEPKFEGAYVKDPVPGKYHWLVDLDATSMYPSIIMTLNISPECKIAKLKEWSNSDFQKGVEKTYKIELGDKIIEFDKTEFEKFISQENLGISSNGVLYELTNKGIIPEILEVWFDERTEMKNLVKKYGKELNADGSVNIHYDKNKLEFYNTRQKIQKTLLNSLYGVLGLPSFRYYDLDNAEAVTTTGVDLIKFAQKVTNNYFIKNLKNKILIELDDGQKIILNENDEILINRNGENIKILAKNILETDDFLKILH